MSKITILIVGLCAFIIGINFFAMYLKDIKSDNLLVDSDKDKEIVQLKDLITDLTNSDIYNHYSDNCLEWGKKQFTESIHEVNGIECPRIIQDSYNNDNDYECEVCTQWEEK